MRCSDALHSTLQGENIRYVLHPFAQRLIENYLVLGGHGTDADGSLFRSVWNNRTEELERPLNPNSIYWNVGK